MNGFNLESTSIPMDEIRRGGPPRDGIPSIDNPIFVSAGEAKYPDDSDRDLGVAINGLAKAYPIGIMNYHEIVNDYFNSTAVVVTYCPLCGSGIAFYSKVEDKLTLLESLAFCTIAMSFCMIEKQSHFGLN